MEIRSEHPGEAEAIRALTEAAFAGAAFADGSEPAIPGRLREAGALALSLVADEGEVVGHVAFSPVRIEGRDRGWFGLGPLAVRPDRQGRGIGAALVREGLARLAARGAAGCVVLGDPAFYGRHGFAAHPGLRLGDAPSPFLQALPLGAPTPRGRVAFHAAFGPG